MFYELLIIVVPFHFVSVGGRIISVNDLVIIISVQLRNLEFVFIFLEKIEEIFWAFLNKGFQTTEKICGCYICNIRFDLLNDCFAMI